AAEGSREDSRSIPRPDGTVDRKSPSRPTESHDPILVARQSIHDGHFEVGPGDYCVPRVSCEWCSRKRARAEIPAQSVLREHRFVLEPEQSQQAVLSSRLSTESRPGISSRFRPDVPSGIGASENDRKGCMKRDWMLGLTALIASFTSGSPASAQTASASPTSPPNPFYSASKLQFESPPFDKIRDSDYQPAIEEGMKQQLAEIEAIAAQSEPPTFANTIEGMERTGVLLTRVTKVFVNLAQSNTNSTIQK